jgi:hypothetical protein
VNRAERRVAAKKRKDKKDAKKARARERTRARDALERLRRRQERDGLPREPSPETPDDDDDDEDDDQDDDMAACLGLSPDLRLGQGPSVSRTGTSGSRSEERGQTEGVLDPSAEVVEVTPGSQAKLPVPPKNRCPCRLRRRAILGSSWLRLGSPSRGCLGRPRRGRYRSRQQADLGGTFEDRGARDLPTCTIDHGPERVSVLGYLRPGSSFVCPDPDFPFLLSKQRHGSTGLAPRKVLKTTLASAASAAPGLRGQLTPSQDAPKRGAQAAPVAVGLAPEADSCVEAAVTLGEAAGAAVALGPPDVLPALSPASAEAVAVLAVEPPVAADAEMAEASLPVASEEGA